VRKFPALAAVLFAAAISAQDHAAHARKIHAETIGVDSHIDTLQRVLIENVDISRRLTTGHIDLPRLGEGGVRAPFFALWVPTYYKGSEAVRRTLQLRDAMQRLLDAHPNQLQLATTASDAERIARAGMIAAILTIEGGHQIADDLAVLRMYHRLGIRSMTLTHFRNNNWADSSTDTPRHNGLTEFGREVVKEMNRIGMIVDISHVSDRTFFDALAVATKPVIASHSSCWSLSKVPRNMRDELIRAVGRNGGVIGLNFGAGFISQRDADDLMGRITTMAAREPDLAGKALDAYAAKEHRAEYHEKAYATLADVVAHVDHVVKLAGIDHVGIGSDFDGVSSVPAGLEDVSKLPALTAELLRRGYSETDVKKFLGGNFLRVLRQVTGR